jgi:hypothetical protein
MHVRAPRFTFIPRGQAQRVSVRFTSASTHEHNNAYLLCIGNEEENVIAIKFKKQLTATKESRKYRQESSGAIPPTGV